MSEVLARNLFPVEVFAPHLGDAPIANAKVFVTTERVQLWTEDEAGQPQLTYEGQIAGPPVERNRGTLFGQLRIGTPDGMVYVTAQRGCGCGSSLKALDPPVGW